MIDLAETMPIVKLFFFHGFQSSRLTKMIITLGMYATGSHTIGQNKVRPKICKKLFG